MSESTAGSQVASGLLRRLLTVDPEDSRKHVNELKERAPLASGSDLSRLIIEHHARRAALRGFVAGLPGGLAMVPLAIFDTRGVLASTASAAAELAYVQDPSFFDRESWFDDTLLRVAGVSLAGRVVGRVAARHALRLVVGRALMRSAATKITPVVGAFLGAGWNYAWTKREIGRIYESLQVDGTEASKEQLVLSDRSVDRAPAVLDQSGAGSAGS